MIDTIEAISGVSSVVVVAVLGILYGRAERLRALLSRDVKTLNARLANAIASSIQDKKLIAKLREQRHEERKKNIASLDNGALADGFNELFDPVGSDAD